MLGKYTVQDGPKTNKNKISIVLWFNLNFMALTLNV